MINDQQRRFITSESVTEGHPDKVCDQIADAILDEALRQDPNSRVACEVCANTGFVVIFGEITTKAVIDYEKIARSVLLDIGYNSSESGFDANNCAILVSLSKQSTDIALGVDNSIEVKDGASKLNKYDKIGAGDQGMMYGFACTETAEYMPLALMLSHKLTKRLTEVRKNNILNYLYPDGKAQVTVEYNQDKHEPTRIEAIVVSAQHSADTDIAQLRKDIRSKVIDFVIPSKMVDENTKIYINPTGRFVVGGPKGDSGLTGRKIIVDTYGSYSPHGGGAFSGKDPTKVDRSATYQARYVAKNLVAAGLAKKCQVSLAYAIGVARPVSIEIDTYGTSEYDHNVLVKAVEEVFDFRPAAIIDNLKLREPIYRKTTNYGHFGRDIFTWEKIDKKEALLKAIKKFCK